MTQAASKQSAPCETTGTTPSRDLDRLVAKIQPRAAILSGVTPLGIPRIVKVWCIQLKEGEALFQANLYNRASPESPAT
tara:strand:+ start:866 stop:1102 length:237 start_codon:yes stop_codon:yes gene_type:complete